MNGWRGSFPLYYKVFIYVKDSESIIWWIMYAEVLFCDSAICVEYGVLCFFFFFEKIDSFLCDQNHHSTPPGLLSDIWGIQISLIIIWQCERNLISVWISVRVTWSSITSQSSDRAVNDQAGPTEFLISWKYFTDKRNIQSWVSNSDGSATLRKSNASF